MNIFVGSLPYHVEEADLRSIFEEYGEVASSKVIMDRFTGKSRGFGFIEMPDEDIAKKAIEELNGAELDGRAIVVNVSEDRKKSDRPRGGGGFRNGGGNGNYRGGNNDGGYRGGYNN